MTDETPGECIILTTAGEPEQAWCPACLKSSAFKTPVIFSDYETLRVVARSTHTQCQDCGWNPMEAS